MNSSTRLTTLTGTALALTAAMALTACGGDDASSDAEPRKQTKTSEAAAVMNPLVAAYDGGRVTDDRRPVLLAPAVPAHHGERHLTRPAANRAVPASVTGSGQCCPARSSTQQGTAHSRTGASRGT
ncbi:hypothetical protein STENM327S_05834 [Streptomyces tendae]